MLFLGGGGDFSSVYGLPCLLFLWTHLGIVSPQAQEFGFRFVSWPSWQVVAPGSEVTLSCATNLAPDAVIQWQHNHRFIAAQNASSVDLSATGEEQYFPRVINDESKEKSQLILKISPDAQESKRQEGLYQCVASMGSIALTSLPGRIEVAFLKHYPQEKSSIQHLEVRPGNAFRIPCQRPESLPEATLHFYKDGQLLELSDERKFRLTQTGELVVLNAGPSSEGEYSCWALHEFLPIKSENPSKTIVSLRKVRDPNNPTPRPPRLVSFDSVVSAPVGHHVQLLCVAINSSPSFLRWSRKGSDQPLEAIQGENTISLVLKNLSVNDEGIYRCYGNNSLGSSFVDVTVFVQEPPYAIKGPEKQSVSEGSRINLECIFGGRPAPTVAWVFNGKLLTNSRTVRVLGSQLELNPVERGQAGIYQCFAFNPFGSSQATSIVTVIPKTVTVSPYPPVARRPNSAFYEREIDVLLESESEEDKPDRRKKDKKKKKERKGKNKDSKRKFKKTDVEREMIAPTRPNVTKISDESVMVTWDVELGRGIPILFFKVQYRTLLSPDKESVPRRWKTVDEDIPPHVKSFEVTGLKTHHVYRFRVLAVYVNNDNQPGPSSRKFFLEKDIKLQRPEKPPQILFLLPESNTSLTLFWNYDAVTHTEGFIIYYREATSAAGYTKVTLLGEDRRNHTISYLQPHVSYDFKMNSFNMAGTSDFSQIKTFHVKGDVRDSEKKQQTEQPSTVVPIVRSDPDGTVTNRLLYIALGAGLGVLLLIVVASYTIYSCRSRNSPDEDETDGKFIDASLRIHRLSTGDVRQTSTNGFQCHVVGAENQVPLLTKQQNILKNNARQLHHSVPPHLNEEVPGKKAKHNGNVNILRETSFAGRDQPHSMEYRENSLRSNANR